MKKIVICMTAAMLSLILCFSVLAEATRNNELLESLEKLFFHTGNVTLTGSAEFSLEGQNFKNAEFILKQNGSQSFRQLLLNSVRSNGKEQKNGYTIFSSGDYYDVIEVAEPGVYRSGVSGKQHDSILRETVETKQLLSLASTLAGQADLFFGKDALTETDGEIRIEIGEDVSPIFNAMLNQAFRLAAKRYFFVDFDMLQADQGASIYSYNTKTYGLLYNTRNLSVKQASVTLKKDADGSIQHMEGKVTLNVETAKDGTLQLETAFRADVSDVGKTEVEKFDAEKYHVVSPWARMNMPDYGMEAAEAEAEAAEEAAREGK